jgi:hypothetical protein
VVSREELTAELTSCSEEAILIVKEYYKLA